MQGLRLKAQKATAGVELYTETHFTFHATSLINALNYSSQDLNKVGCYPLLNRT